MARPALFLAAAILITSLAWSSSGLVTLLLVTGAAILLLAAFRFPRKSDPMRRIPPKTQFVRLAVFGAIALLAFLLVLYVLVRTSCPPAGCV
jgi:uncharacterized membrane protein YidH (DUF202 family)